MDINNDIYNNSLIYNTLISNDFFFAYMYVISLLVSGLSIILLINSYIEYDYFKFNNNVKSLLHNINELFDIFSNETIDTMNIHKMNYILYCIKSKKPIIDFTNSHCDTNSDSDSDSDTNSNSDTNSDTTSDNTNDKSSDNTSDCDSELMHFIL